MFHGLLSCDWTSGGSVGAFFRHGMVSGLRRESMLFQGMGMEFEDKIVLRFQEGVLWVSSATGVLSWVYDVLGELQVTCLSA